MLSEGADENLIQNWSPGGPHWGGGPIRPLKQIRKLGATFLFCFRKISLQKLDGLVKLSSAVFKIFWLLSCVWAKIGVMFSKRKAIEGRDVTQLLDQHLQIIHWWCFFNCVSEFFSGVLSFFTRFYRNFYRMNPVRLNTWPNWENMKKWSFHSESRGRGVALLLWF